MAVSDPKAWVHNVERLYRAYDAEGVKSLYTNDAHTRFGSTILPPHWVQAHPGEWFSSLDDYELTRTFRAATGDIIVSETTASYVMKSDGNRYREFGVDIYWVNDDGKIYHKHTVEIVRPFDETDMADVESVCGQHDHEITPAERPFSEPQVHDQR
jgi:hypothetical protein